MDRQRIIDLLFLPVSEPIILIYPVLALLGIPFAAVGWAADIWWARTAAIVLIAPIGVAIPARILLALVMVRFLPNTEAEDK